MSTDPMVAKYETCWRCGASAVDPEDDGWLDDCGKCGNDLFAQRSSAVKFFAQESGVFLDPRDRDTDVLVHWDELVGLVELSLDARAIVVGLTDEEALGLAQALELAVEEARRSRAAFAVETA